MDSHSIFAVIGFCFASLAVVSNDSIQTLGTFISSNQAKNWIWQWIGASVILVVVLTYGWYAYDGDISYGRLSKIPLPEIQWYHAVAPMMLLVLTRFGFPVSTTFLVLSAFASNVVLEKMIVKSFLGYGVAAIVSCVFWLLLSYFLDEHEDIPESHKSWWRGTQWLSTGFLWSQWLQHDMANIAVYLPRQMGFGTLLMAMSVLVVGLGWIFSHRGGKIQQVVLNKSSTRYVRSATIIDFVYALILLYFKQHSQIPMSTTWVFVGLLSGRELAIYRLHHPKHMRKVFPLLGQDFFKIMVGLGCSIGLAYAIHAMN